MEKKTEIKLDWHESLTLKDLFELVKDEDPAKVDIDVDFEVPDWTRIVISVYK
jgi:hypothetical protein